MLAVLHSAMESDIENQLVSVNPGLMSSHVWRYFPNDTGSKLSILIGSIRFSIKKMRLFQARRHGRWIGWLSRSSSIAPGCPSRSSWESLNPCWLTATVRGVASGRTGREEGFALKSGEAVSALHLYIYIYNEFYQKKWLIYQRVPSK